MLVIPRGRQTDELSGDEELWLCDLRADYFEGKGVREAGRVNERGAGQIPGDDKIWKFFGWGV